MALRLSVRDVLRGGLRAVPYAATAAYAAGLWAVMSRHEMWRDEIQAWLLARDSTTPWALLHNMRYEGHPGLWHLLLWGPAHLTADPVAMQMVHAVIATASVLLLLRFAPFNLITRLLLAGGYFMAYEWGVVSRNYAISVLLLFAVAALHRRRWVWFPAQAALLFALCHTNIHSILLVLVLAPTLAIEYAVAYAGRYHDAPRVLPRVLAGFLIIACGLVSGIRQTSPPDDTGFAPGWNWKWSQGQARQTACSVFNAALPLPPDNVNFWTNNSVTQKVPPESLIPWALLILAIGCLFFAAQPWPIVPYLAGSAVLLVFFYVKYPGTYRHHGFLFLNFVVLLWMTWDYQRLRLPWRWADLPVGYGYRFRDVLLWPLLIVHIAGTCVAVKQDWKAPFSNGKAAAAWLHGKYGDGSGHVLIGDSCLEASTVVGYAPFDRVFYASRNDYGSYVIWDNKWRGVGNLPNAIKRFRANGTNDLVLILSGPAPSMPGVKLVQSAAFTEPSIAHEQYYLYTVQ